MSTTPVGAASAEASDGNLRLILEGLGRIEQRLSRLEALADGALTGGRDALGWVTDVVDARAREARARGVELDSRASQLLGLLERLTEPQVLSALERALVSLPGLPQLLAGAVDTADHVAQRLQSGGVDVDRRLYNLARAAERLSSDEALEMLEATFGRIDRIQRVLESGVLDPASVSIVAQAGRALADAAAEPRTNVGPWGLLRAFGEPEVCAALALLLSFARRMGASLQRGAETAQLPAPPLPVREPIKEHP